MSTRVTERSLYPPLSGYLKELGFNSVSEIKDTSGQLDILAIKEENKFVIEVKIGDPHEKIIKGLEQALKYAKDNNTDNVIVINFPDSIRTVDISTLDMKTLTTITNTFSAHEFLIESKDVCPKLLFDELNNLILTKRRINDVDVNLVIRAISEAINQINNTLRNLNKKDIDNLIRLITGKLDLFLALSELKKEEEIQNMTLNLISYLLVNQMLFYHIFSKKSQRIPELARIHTLHDLKIQFNNITKIDYKSIYQIDVISRLPENIKIINSLNEIIDLFEIVKPEFVEHDLIGRLFHDLLPYETRKILAAFYTNPVAADILAGLCINSSKDKVIDPACGSGTLLVSAYKEKLRLDEENTNKTELHHYFVEEEITGIDIMPFAAHLTAINLSSMNIETPSDNLNVGVMDSLSLSNKLKNKNVYKMEEFSRELQTTIDLFGKGTQTALSNYTSTESSGAVTADSKGSGFKIRKNSFDTVIANPPFSDREKMPNDYLKVLNSYSEITDKCGSQVNLWGYFLALNEILLKKNGVFGFIIPINIFRGAATQKIREYLLNHYTIQYVVKTGKNTAFSEKASLRDIIIVAKRKVPKPSNKFKFILINEDLHDLTFLDAINISKYIKEEILGTGLNIDMIELRHQVLFDNIDNLMPIFGLMNTKSSKILGEFNNTIQQKIGHLLKKMDKKIALEGFRPVPAGSNDLLFITNNFKENRIKKAFLTLKKETENEVTAVIKDLPDKEFIFPKNILIKSMRTSTDVNTMNIEDKLDYIITQPTNDYSMLLNLSKVKNKEKWSYKNYCKEINSKWTYMITSRRFRPNSKNTFLFAFYSDTPFVPNNLFKIIRMEETEAKINTLFLNSSMGILNLILLKEQTTESYTDIQQGDLKNFDIIDINKLDEETIDDLLDLYDELKDNEFKSLVAQFTEQTKNRIKLDTKLLTILGFERKEIEKMLPQVYEAISYELRNG